MKIIQIINKNQPLAAPLRVPYCDSYLGKLRGLMFRPSLPVESGLLLVEASDNRVNASIHMLFCFTDLAVVWINNEQQVVDTVLAKVWRPAYVPHQAARYTLEIHPSRLNEFKIGDHIEFLDA